MSLAFVGLLSNCVVLGQEDSGTDSSGDLPAYAVHRLGEYGDEVEYNGAYRIVFSPDNSKIAVRSQDQVVRVWDLKSGRQLTALDGHEYRVSDLVFLRDSRRLVTAASGNGENVIVWDVTNGKILKKIERDNAVKLDIQFGNDPSEDKLVIANGNEIELYDLTSLEKTGTSTWNTERVNKIMELASGGKTFVAFSQQSLIRKKPCLEFASEFAQGRSFFYGFSQQPTEVKVSSQIYWLAACVRKDPSVYLWQTNHPQDLIKLEGHLEQVQSIDFSQDERYLISASWDRQVRVWESMTGKELATLGGHTEHVCSVGISQDGRYIATGAAGRTDCSVIVWDLRKAILEQQEKTDMSLKTEATIWSDLSSNDASRAYATIALLLNHQQKAIDVIGDQLISLAPMIDEAEIPMLIAQLDSDEYEVRESAQRKLISVRPQAEDQLREALKNEESPEKRYRIREILNAKDYRPKTTKVERLALHRSILLLELFASEQSQNMLQRLAKSHSDERVKAEAKHALARIVH